MPFIPVMWLRFADLSRLHFLNTRLHISHISRYIVHAIFIKLLWSYISVWMFLLFFFQFNLICVCVCLFFLFSDYILVCACMYICFDEKSTLLLFSLNSHFNQYWPLSSQLLQAFGILNNLSSSVFIFFLCVRNIKRLWHWKHRQYSGQGYFEHFVSLITEKPVSSRRSVWPVWEIW